MKNHSPVKKNYKKIKKKLQKRNYYLPLQTLCRDGYLPYKLNGQLIYTT
jgi:hypothetical protein